MESSKVSSSWWCSTIPSSSSSPNHHLRLLLTLSELNKNVTRLLRLMRQEDGDGETPARQTEEAAACAVKTELQRRVEEFYCSYCSLAGYWEDNFGSKVDPPDPSPGPGIGSSRLRRLLPGDKDGDPEDDDDRQSSKDGDPEGPPTPDVADSLDWHVSRSEQMWMTAKDVVGELARRHDEKREACRALRRQAERMVEEGRLLRLDYERVVSENGALHSKLDSMAGAGKNSRSCARCSSLVKKQRRRRLFFFFSRFKSLFCDDR